MLFRTFLVDQLLGRITGGGLGHAHGATFFLWSWPLLFLPWTPMAILALVRSLQRAVRREADPLGLFLVLWALVPVGLFSLFATKLLSYVLPVAPAMALLVVRAGVRGELSDGWGRRAVRVSTGLLALAALGMAFALGARAWSWDALHSMLALDRLASPDAVAAVLALLGAAAALAAFRGARLGASNGGVTGVAAGTAALFGLGFHAVAPAMPTLREPARLVRRVPEARLVQHSTFAAGMLFYTGRTWRSYVAANACFCSTSPHAGREADLCLHRKQSVKLLRGAAPTFTLVERPHAEELARATGAAPVWESSALVLLANAAARERLAAVAAAGEHAP